MRIIPHLFFFPLVSFFSSFFLLSSSAYFINQPFSFLFSLYINLSLILIFSSFSPLLFLFLPNLHLFPLDFNLSSMYICQLYRWRAFRFPAPSFFLSFLFYFSYHVLSFFFSYLFSSYLHTIFFLFLTSLFQFLCAFFYNFSCFLFSIFLWKPFLIQILLSFIG